MKLPLPERLRQPPKRRHDQIRLIAGFSIALADFGYSFADGAQYTTAEKGVIYPTLALALALIATPMNRFGENYYGNYDDEGNETKV